MSRRQSLTPTLILVALSILSSCDRSSSAVKEHTRIEAASSASSFGVSDSSAPLVGGGRVDIAGAANVRSVGPLMARGNRRIKPFRLMRSGHLAMVNEEGWARMVELGIASVVDLRSASEGHATPDAPWVRSGTRHVAIELPEVVALDPSSTARTFDALESKLAELFAHLGVANALPVLVHCSAGKGRACVGMAVILLALGVSPSDVAKDFRENQDDEVDPHLLDGLFARVAAAGGIDGYLRMHSVSSSDVERLRAQALE